MQIVGGALLAPELIERLVGFERLKNSVGQFAAWAERLSGVEVGQGWASALSLLIAVALLLSYPLVVGVYVLLSAGVALVPPVRLPLLVPLGCLALIIWLALAALGLSIKPSKSLPEAPVPRATGANARPSLSWTIPFGRSRMQSEVPVPPPPEMLQNAGASDEERSTLRERLSWAALLSSVVPLAAATFLALFPPFFLVWLLSRGMAGLAEGLRSAVVPAGFMFFLCGLCLQLLATF